MKSKIKFFTVTIPLLNLALPLSAANAATHDHAETSHAQLALEKEKLNQRIETVRRSLANTDPTKIEVRKSGVVAQWYNWDNWRNGWGNQWYNYR